MQKARRYCPRCRQYVVGERADTAHTAHLLGTLATGGLWAPAWILSSKGKPWICPHCGTETLEKKPAEQNPVRLGCLLAVLGALAFGILAVTWS